MPMENIFELCGKLINSYSNVFFVHFLSFLVLVHVSEKVTVHPPPVKVRDKVFLLVIPPPLSKVDAIK